MGGGGAIPASQLSALMAAQQPAFQLLAQQQAGALATSQLRQSQLQVHVHVRTDPTTRSRIPPTPRHLSRHLLRTHAHTHHHHSQSGADDTAAAKKAGGSGGGAGGASGSDEGVGGAAAHAFAGGSAYDGLGVGRSGVGLGSLGGALGALAQQNLGSNLNTLPVGSRQLVVAALGNQNPYHAYGGAADASSSASTATGSASPSTAASASTSTSTSASAATSKASKPKPKPEATAASVGRREVGRSRGVLAPLVATGPAAVGLAHFLRAGMEGLGDLTAEDLIAWVKARRAERRKEEEATVIPYGAVFDLDAEVPEDVDDDPASAEPTSGDGVGVEADDGAKQGGGKKGKGKGGSGKAKGGSTKTTGKQKSAREMKSDARRQRHILSEAAEKMDDGIVLLPETYVDLGIVTHPDQRPWPSATQNPMHGFEWLLAGNQWIAELILALAPNLKEAVEEVKIAIKDLIYEDAHMSVMGEPLSIGTMRPATPAASSPAATECFSGEAAPAAPTAAEAGDEASDSDAKAAGGGAGAAAQDTAVASDDAQEADGKANDEAQEADGKTKPPPGTIVSNPYNPTLYNRVGADGQLKVVHESLMQINRRLYPNQSHQSRIADHARLGKSAGQRNTGPAADAAITAAEDAISTGVLMTNADSPASETSGPLAPPEPSEPSEPPEPSEEPKMPVPPPTSSASSPPLPPPPPPPGPPPPLPGTDSSAPSSSKAEPKPEPQAEEPKAESVLTQPKVQAGLKTPRMVALAKSLRALLKETPALDKIDESLGKAVVEAQRHQRDWQVLRVTALASVSARADMVYSQPHSKAARPQARAAQITNPFVADGEDPCKWDWLLADPAIAKPHAAPVLAPDTPPAPKFETPRELATRARLRHMYDSGMSTLYLDQSEGPSHLMRQVSDMLEHAATAHDHWGPSLIVSPRAHLLAWEGEWSRAVTPETCLV